MVREKVFMILPAKIQYVRIWFDILTPKQVLFFQPAISRLKNLGHEVLVTSREYWEAVELARIKKLEITRIGSHGGADRYAKLRASADRVYKLAEVVRNFNPNVAVHFSSPEGARVAFGLGIRQIGVNDSPHAVAVARLTVPLLSSLITPWVIPISLWKPYGIERNRIKKYHALDPAAWLKNEKQSVLPDTEFDPRPNKIAGRKRILVRLEESKAAYIVDRKLSLDSSMLDTLVSRFSDSARVVIMCRYADQIELMKQKYGDRADVLENVTDGTNLILSADVFVGAGGTMTSEAALLGKPTISIAPHKFEVESYLERAGLAKKVTSSKALVLAVENYLTDPELVRRQLLKASRILDSMEDPTDKIVEEVLREQTR